MTSGDFPRKSLARGGIIGFAGAATSALLGFAFSIMLARLLGSEGAGVVTQATGVFALVMALTKLGLDSTAIYLFPRLCIDDPRAIRPSLRYMILLSASVSLAAVLVVRGTLGFVWGETNRLVLEAANIVLWFVPIGAGSLIVSAALRSVGQMRHYVLVQNILLPTSRLLLVAGIIGVTTSYTAAAVAWALPFPLAFVAAVILLIPRLPEADEQAGLLPDRDRRRSIIAFALPRTLSAGLEQMLTWLDVLLVGILVGNAAAGVYGGAIRFIQAGMIVDTALRIVVSPQFSRLLHLRERERLSSLYSTATIWLVLFATPIHLLMAIFAPALMRILGEDFASGAGVLVILCGGATVTFCAGNIHSLLIMSGRSTWAALNKTVVVVLNAIGNLVLVPRGGILAAAAVWAGCMVIDAGMALIQVRAFIGLSPRIGDVARPLMSVLLFVGIPAGGVAWGLNRDSFAAMGLGIGLGVVGFLLMCRLMARSLHLSGLRELFRSRQ